MNTPIEIITNKGINTMSNIDDVIISNILFATLHHAVIDTEDNSTIGIHHIQFSHDELIGVYFEIFGYMSGIP